MHRSSLGFPRLLPRPPSWSFLGTAALNGRAQGCATVLRRPHPALVSTFERSSLRHSLFNFRRAFATLTHPRSPQLPRPHPTTTNFETIDASELIEEERFTSHGPRDFYPVRIWDVLHSRYQVVAKLGHGAYSTVWLCRDLVEHCHVTVKVCTQMRIPVERELSALKHLNSLPASERIGRTFIRTALDHFELPAHPKSSDPASFPCFVYKPMATSLYQFRKLFPQRRFPEQLLRSILLHVLSALHYLHTEAKMIHADIQEGNILLSLDSPKILEEFEEEEWNNPSPRKVDGDRVVYLSRLMDMHMDWKDYGPPTLCDFGEARFGSATYTDLIQPDVYRAPEVILAIPWDEKVDVWSVGVMIWDMFEGTHMFKTTGGPEDKYRTVNHLAHMFSLLGPPPVDFLKRTEVDWIPWKYFDDQGNWIGAASVPEDSLEQLEENLEGEDKAQFLAFVRKMVTWKPEDRCSVEELLKDPWLNKN